MHHDDDKDRVIETGAKSEINLSIHSNEYYIRMTISIMVGSLTEYLSPNQIKRCSRYVEPFCIYPTVPKELVTQLPGKLPK